MQAVRRPQSTTEDPMAGNTGVVYKENNGSSASCFGFSCHQLHGFRFSLRYFYAISSDVAIKRPGRLVKVDTKTSKVG